jgi:hypothetical protein
MESEGTFAPERCEGVEVLFRQAIIAVDNMKLQYFQDDDPKTQFAFILFVLLVKEVSSQLPEACRCEFVRA